MKNLYKSNSMIRLP
jgi:hypothetical protein